MQSTKATNEMYSQQEVDIMLKSREFEYDNAFTRMIEKKSKLEKELEKELREKKNLEKQLKDALTKQELLAQVNCERSREIQSEKVRNASLVEENNRLVRENRERLDMDRRVRELARENSELRAKMGSALETSEVEKRKNSELAEKLDEKEKTILQLMGELKGHCEKVSFLEKRLEEELGKSSSLDKDLVAARKSLSSLQDKLEDQEILLDSTMALLDDSKLSQEETVSNGSLEILRLERKLNDEREKLRLREEELAEMSSLASTMEQVNFGIEEKNMELNESIKFKEAMIVDLNGLIASLKHDIERLQLNIVEERRDFGLLQRDYDTVIEHYIAVDKSCEAAVECANILLLSVYMQEFENFDESEFVEYEVCDDVLAEHNFAEELEFVRLKKNVRGLELMQKCYEERKAIRASTNDKDEIDAKVAELVDDVIYETVTKLVSTDQLDFTTDWIMFEAYEAIEADVEEMSPEAIDEQDNINVCFEENELDFIDYEGFDFVEDERDIEDLLLEKKISFYEQRRTASILSGAWMIESYKNIIQKEEIDKFTVEFTNDIFEKSYDEVCGESCYSEITW